jgi:hypothetical protein
VARIRATFHFSVRELLVHPDLLGSARDIQIGDHLVRVILPVQAADQDNDRGRSTGDLDPFFPSRDRAPDLPGTSRTHLSMTLGPSSTIATVKLIRVEVFFDWEVAAADFADSAQTRDSPAFEPAHDALKKAEAIARDGLERFLEWVRVRGRQHWLGLARETFEGVGEAELVDLDAGNRLPVASQLQPGLVIRRIREEQVLDVELLDEAVRLSDEGQTPSLADSLLADALFLAQDAEPADPARALLVAAIACEIKIKATLRERASDAQRELIDVLLSNPRDWALAASHTLTRRSKRSPGSRCAKLTTSSGRKRRGCSNAATRSLIAA